MLFMLISKKKKKELMLMTWIGDQSNEGITKYEDVAWGQCEKGTSEYNEYFHDECIYYCMHDVDSVPLCE